jgi:hypothetical protein
VRISWWPIGGACRSLVTESATPDDWIHDDLAPVSEARRGLRRLDPVPDFRPPGIQIQIQIQIRIQVGM